MDAVDYSKQETPADYKCGDCGATGVRLWLEYQTISPKLLCATCAEADQKKSHDPGWQSPFSLGQGDQIGWYVPAVPHQDGVWYWGYTSVPDAGVSWWKNLPTNQSERSCMSFTGQGIYAGISYIVVEKEGKTYIALQPAAITHFASLGANLKLLDNIDGADPDEVMEKLFASISEDKKDAAESIPG